MHKFNIRRIGNVKAGICNISTYIHAALFHGNRKRHHQNCVRNKKITETKNISSDPGPRGRMEIGITDMAKQMSDMLARGSGE